MSKHEALMQIEDLLVSIEQQADELKTLFRENFPSHYEQLSAYDAFNLTGSWNRYDVTIDRAFQSLADEDFEEYED